MTAADRVTNILVVGIGGQGVMTAAEMLARAALAQGYDVKKTEVAGMAQRGGVVSSHVRFGPKIYSPQIDPGEADLLIGFEAAEALRWLPYLRPTGVAMVNTLRLAPPVVSAGLYDYPLDPIGELAAAGIAVHAFDAGALADELGNSKLVNTIMLGAISDYLPFPATVLEECIVAGFRAYKPKLADINARAFAAGRAAGHV
ncbi:indolepyruvate oxidoreductase subunit beta [Candidatus Contendibacter odensensis]|uniref:Indolepyruvate ferredoxin oxidoreductase, beta subunit n=1 Tax=Candidatus Contendobacter odensis Run_B_J11 TaxID=1400861 RepID=A0A7U7GDI5_9GAMM|nr:indolepyruvate oxidoreductase subunit beta [Candidatus Contendobacter odensis]MBK8753900.1 indolepyruvate oxidoreductase subunit beta [Candidatus Competibacteraceae bacterium]CDH46413.1 Indolepyruvate ferredoxin oxidoreductase, beta subunit [Candidatus Contendobacter odensis Run_B_J11]